MPKKRAYNGIPIIEVREFTFYTKQFRFNKCEKQKFLTIGSSQIFFERLSYK